MTMAAWLFGAAGVALATIGAFFVFLRPPLLPEDLRFLGRGRSEIEGFMPQLEAWLRRVFTVLGGHALAAGGLTVYVAAKDVPAGGAAPVVALVLTGTVSIGVMTAVNFALRSDFRWMLVGCAALWAGGGMAAVLA